MAERKMNNSIVITILEEQETFLLVERRDDRGKGFAVVERRNGRLYNCHNAKREGIRLDDLQALPAIVDEADWIDLATAKAALDEAALRWRDLAEHML
jgi:hypothetical protein